jgi:anti-sigma B factor antagonist
VNSSPAQASGGGTDDEGHGSQDRRRGDVVVVDLTGKITIGEGDVVLRERVGELLEGGERRILLNLERVKYMDSAGIGELVACYKRAREKSGTVKLLNPSGKVYDLLQLTKLEEVFDTFRDEKEALVSFGAR